MVEQDQDTFVQASEFGWQTPASVTFSAQALQAKQEIEETLNLIKLVASLGITGQHPHERNVCDPVNLSFQVVRERPQVQSGSLILKYGYKDQFPTQWTSTPAHTVQGRFSNWPTQKDS